MSALTDEMMNAIDGLAEQHTARALSLVIVVGGDAGQRDYAVEIVTRLRAHGAHSFSDGLPLVRGVPHTEALHVYQAARDYIQER